MPSLTTNCCGLEFRAIKAHKSYSGDKFTPNTPLKFYPSHPYFHTKLLHFNLYLQHNIVTVKDALLKRTSYDIPLTAVYDPSTFPLPPVKFVSYPPERLQSIQSEARLCGPVVIHNIIKQILQEGK